MLIVEFVVRKDLFFFLIAILAIQVIIYGFSSFDYWYFFILINICLLSLFFYSFFSDSCFVFLKTSTDSFIHCRSKY